MWLMATVLDSTNLGDVIFVHGIRILDCKTGALVFVLSPNFKSKHFF